MKRIALIAAVLAAITTTASAAGQDAASLDFTSLSAAQLDALTSILAGLPRQ